ncbi:MAG: bifunctional diaminohydroxyphosphoribosylaminopyrimidine deaminase/5-amino-6-(5-phosphoribosylamino)uracil reductase RibD [Bacteroidetes bacterium]|nr:bifunctional diaminohydroxyphosphoribosylaminopyrimidine deaminase/5-amino-6-(5-phosphoribosylamino)uracil reductase RibD [Bacteroidota bacterium]
MNTNEHYMQRCLQLAEQGLGNVGSNPMVGSVIVCDGKIIGEGYHQQFGHSHAEVNAINNVADQHLLSRSTLYVNLEPCSHTGKTPPCSTLILEKKIPSVVIGMKDPFSKVNGSGIAILENAGIKVTLGVLEEDCRELNKRFLCAHTKNRPYIILKWAQSADGFTGRLNERVQISNELSKTYTHKWRSEEMSIMIGANTAIIDDPQLDVRYWKGSNPIKVIIDRSGVLQNHAQLKILKSEDPTYIFTSSTLSLNSPNQVIKISGDGSFMNQVFAELNKLGITSCFVEGGSTLHQLLIQENLWDEMLVFSSPISLGKGIKAPVLPNLPSTITPMDDNTLTIIRNR